VNAALLAAYRATTYRVFPPAAAAPIDLRIDQRNAELDQLLVQFGVAQHGGSATTGGAIISACNPYSRVLSAAENQQRMATFRRRLKSTSWSCLPALGIPDAPDWDAEDSLLLIGIPLKSAQHIAADLEQHAWVWIERQQPVRLHGTSPTQAL
jgi:hypothetical protein